MAPELAVRPPRDEAELRAALALRHDVFCVEQGVSEADEIDGRDGEALHVVAVRNGRVVGTCRVLVDDGIGKLGRMAVARGARRGGVGAQLLDAAEAGARAERRGPRDPRRPGRRRALLLRPRLPPVGGHFVDAGIEHVRMEKALR